MGRENPPSIFLVTLPSAGLFFSLITLLTVGLLAPKLYHNFGAGVKSFFVGVFPYVVFWQPGTILANSNFHACTILVRALFWCAPLWCSLLSAAPVEKLV